MNKTTSKSKQILAFILAVLCALGFVSVSPKAAHAAGLTSAKPSQYILIGDSNVTVLGNAISGSSVLGSGNAKAHAGTAWDSARKIRYSGKVGEHVEWLKSTGVPNIEGYIGQNTAVIIWMGANDVVGYPSDRAKAYADYIKSKTPGWVAKGARVYYGNVAAYYFPKNSFPHITKSAVESFNSKIKGYLNGSGVVQLDMYGHTKNFARDMWGSDGGHFSAAGCRSIYDFIISSVDRDFLLHSGANTPNTWFSSGGQWYYINSNGDIAKNCWAKDSQNWYYLGADGTIQKNCWAKDSKGWCYMDAEGKMTKNKWIKVGGEWYFMKPDGYMAANEFAKDSTGWCFMEASGKMAKNKWILYGGEWYSMNANGYKMTNCWAKDSTSWYWLNAEGKIAKNVWAKDSKGTCRMGGDGKMVINKWVSVDNNWYYLDANGYLKTNAWLKKDGQWVYATNTGALARNAFVKDSKGWCYLNAQGFMTVNEWIEADGAKYYMNASGYRVTGKQTIAGKAYTFDANGKLVG